MTSGELPRWAYWIFLARGCFVFALGVALLTSGSGLSALGNFLAVYWIVGALLTLHWVVGNRASPGHRLGAVAGFLGAAAGCLFLIRELVKELIGQGYLLDLLGLSAVATGLLRLSGAFHDDQFGGAKPRGRYRFVVGSLDVGLGVALVLVSEETVDSVRVVLAVWGLLTGTFLVLDAIHLRRLARSRERSAT